jgi:hypothetical protein
MSRSLKDKVVIITGSTSGIGLGLAQAPEILRRNWRRINKIASTHGLVASATGITCNAICPSCVPDRVPSLVFSS